MRALISDSNRCVAQQPNPLTPFPYKEGGTEKFLFLFPFPPEVLFHVLLSINVFVVHLGLRNSLVLFLKRNSFLVPLPC